MLVPSCSMNIVAAAASSSVSLAAIHANRTDSRCAGSSRRALTRCQRRAPSATAQPTHDPVVPWLPTFHQSARRSRLRGSRGFAGTTPASLACSIPQSASVPTDGSQLRIRPLTTVAMTASVAVARAHPTIGELRGQQVATYGAGMTTPPYDAIVLAGGRARRAGGENLALRRGGRSVLDLAVLAVSDAATVVVVGPVVAVPKVPGQLVWRREDPPYGGPVAAIAAALPELRCERVVVLAGDVPAAVPRWPRRWLRSARTSTSRWSWTPTACSNRCWRRTAPTGCASGSRRAGARHARCSTAPDVSRCPTAGTPPGTSIPVRTQRLWASRPARASRRLSHPAPQWARRLPRNAAIPSRASAEANSDALSRPSTRTPRRGSSRDALRQPLGVRERLRSAEQQRIDVVCTAASSSSSGTTRVRSPAARTRSASTRSPVSGELGARRRVHPGQAHDADHRRRDPRPAPR